MLWGITTMAKKKTEPKAPKEPKPKKPPKEKPKPGDLPTGKLAIRKDPRFYATEVKRPPGGHKRIAGLDLGTSCGISFCDFMPGVIIKTAPIVMGQWDLSLGPYDSGPLRHIRLIQFLTILQPDLIVYEEVKYDPPRELIESRQLGIGGIIARVATAAEFLGGLKTTLAVWAEMHDIPCQGVSIAAIKSFATGKGNASKEQMILAANTQFGVNFKVEDYERTGVDNIVDSAFVCKMGVMNYSEGLTGESKWVGITGGPPTPGGAPHRTAVAESTDAVGAAQHGDGVPTSGPAGLVGDGLRDAVSPDEIVPDDQTAQPAG